MSYMNMGNLKLNERRASERYELSGLLPGTLLRDNNKTISCRPINVSVDGLGIITSEQLKQGDILILKVKELRIQLQVMWSKDDFGKQDLVRYGLKCLDPVSLWDIFDTANLIKHG